MIVDALNLRVWKIEEPEEWNSATLLNSFTNYETAGTFEEAGYRQGGDGRVQLRGLVKRAAVTGTTVVLQLPPAMSPRKQLILDGWGGANGTVGSFRIDVTKAGEVVFFGDGVHNCEYLSLSKLGFYPD